MSDPRRVALCFLISYDHVLNHEDLWTKWIQPNEDIINVYVHYKDIRRIHSPFLRQYALPPSFVQPTTYFNVVPAYFAGLSYAHHHDVTNQWFCLVTDSCVPIVSPARFRQLFEQHGDQSIMKWKPAYWNIRYHKRANLQLLDKRYHLANDPWFTLCRHHVNQCLLFLSCQQTLYHTINAGGLANESLFAIILHMCGELDMDMDQDHKCQRNHSSSGDEPSRSTDDKQKKNNKNKLINASSTVADWVHMSSPTSPNVFVEADEATLTCIRQLIRDNPHAMFLRKVDRSFPTSVLQEMMIGQEPNADTDANTNTNRQMTSLPFLPLWCVSILVFIGLYGILAWTNR